MNCPKCGKEMEKGRIYAGNRLFGSIWFPEGAKPLLDTEKAILRRGGVFLSRCRFFSWWGSYIETFFCKSCRVGLFEAEDV